jgi:hypothetical protein
LKRFRADGALRRSVVPTARASAAPCHLGVHAARRPRPRLSPGCPRPEAPCGPRRARAVLLCAPDRPDKRRVGPPVPRGVPFLCAVPRPAYSVSSSLSKRTSPIKGRRPHLTHYSAAASPCSTTGRQWSAAAEAPVLPAARAHTTPNLLPRPPKSCPHRPFLCPGRELAGVELQADAARPRRRAPPPTAPLPQPGTQIEPW